MLPIAFSAKEFCHRRWPHPVVQGIDESRVIARAARYADEKLFRSFLQKFLKGIM
jgi:hypothetical protein